MMVAIYSDKNLIEPADFLAFPIFITSWYSCLFRGINVDVLFVPEETMTAAMKCL